MGLFAEARGGEPEITGVIPVLVLEEVKIPTSRKGSEKWGTRLDFPDVAIGRDDTLQIVFTSGTTAEPKGVVITHGNVLANIDPLERAMQPYLKYERWVHPVRFLNLLPLSHVFGQFLGMFLPPIVGWDSDFSGGVEAFGDYRHDPAGTRVGARERAESFAIFETED